MAKEPNERYSSLSSLVAAIERLPTEAGARASRTDRLDQPAPPQRAADDRYTVESLAEDHPALQVLNARDNELGRPVLVLRVAPGPHIERLLSLLEAAAPADEHLQRVLALDRQRGQAIVESWNDRVGVSRLQHDALDPDDALRLCEQVATALATLHAANHAHGKVAPEVIYCCGETYVLGLTEALVTQAGSTDPPRPGEDLQALLELCSLGELVGNDEITDAPSLAAWAARQRDQRRTQRQKQLLEQLLAGAPPGVDRE